MPICCTFTSCINTYIHLINMPTGMSVIPIYARVSSIYPKNCSGFGDGWFTVHKNIRIRYFL